MAGVTNKKEKILSQLPISNYIFQNDSIKNNQLLLRYLIEQRNNNLNQVKSIVKYKAFNSSSSKKKLKTVSFNQNIKEVIYIKSFKVYNLNPMDSTKSNCNLI